MTRGAPGDISQLQSRRLGKCSSARSGPGASSHLPSRELNPISFSSEFPLLCKGPFSRLAVTSAPSSSSILLLLQQIACGQNHKCYDHYFILKGLEQPIRSKCWGEIGSVRDQTGRRARPPSPTLKRKIPAKCLGPGRTVLQGPGL